MRIVTICHPTHGGSGVVASDLAMGLAERGHDVHLISNEPPFRVRWQPNLVYHAVDVGDYPLFRFPPYELNLTNKIIEVVEEYDIDLVHSHYAIPHAHAAWMAKQVVDPRRDRPLRLACTLHGTDITLVGREPSFFELTRFAIAQQDLLTAPSHWLAEQTERHFGQSRDAIAVIPNFVDLDLFTPVDEAPMRSQIAPDDWRIITHASNFRKVKRIDEVIRSFAVLRQRLPAVLALVGNGPELAPAERLARELGVRDDLRILGTLDDVVPIMQSSDLFFLPSQAESFGLVALEAMACGCPVFGYRAGGLPEVVDDELNGILCEPGKNQCMGTMAADILEDAPRYAAMRAAARKKAEAFDEREAIGRYETALRSMLLA